MKTILDIFQLNITRSPDNGTDGARLSVKCQSKIHFDQTWPRELETVLARGSP